VDDSEDPGLEVGTSGKTQNRNLAQQNRIMQMSRNCSNYAALHMILYYLRDQEEFSITRDCIIHGLYSFYGVVHNSIEMAVSKAVDKDVERRTSETCM